MVHPSKSCDLLYQQQHQKHTKNRTAPKTAPNFYLRSLGAFKQYRTRYLAVLVFLKFDHFLHSPEANKMLSKLLGGINYQMYHIC